MLYLKSSSARSRNNTLKAPEWMNGWDCLNTPDPFSVKPGNELYTVDKQSSALIYRYFDVIKAIGSTAPSIKHTALAFYKPTRLAYEWLIWVFALTLITSCSACIRSSQKVSRCQSACIYTVLCLWCLTCVLPQHPIIPELKGITNARETARDQRVLQHFPKNVV